MTKAGNRAAAGQGERRRSGQAIILLVVVVVLLAVIALWNFDLHKVLYVKNVSQNAGDAAALAAARWQGLTLNLIGDLNIMQAVALSGGDTNEAAAIADLQARLCYVGPMVGLMAAQQAAKNNGVFNNPEFAQRLRDHALVVRTEYPQTGGDGTMLFPEPYPRCWEEYADMLTTVADQGLAAGPDNARYYNDYSGGHILLEEDFYSAVAGQDWCWFLFNAPDLLRAYTSFLWWPPLPDMIPHTDPINSEFFGLGLRRITAPCGSPVAAAMEDIREERGLGSIPVEPYEAGTATSVWYCYSGVTWGPWTAMGRSEDYVFPAAGTVKPQFDYAGADAAIRVEAGVASLTPRMGSGAIRTNRVVWSAAAKPFGYLNDGEDRPNAYAMVLPAFHQVRLIPVDASSAPSGGSFNIAWRKHIEEHLPEYMQSGPESLSSSCAYCAALVAWESGEFRQSGIDWLAEHADQCDDHSGGGYRGGGTRRGH